jgi:purine catabolism regulator
MDASAAVLEPGGTVSVSFGKAPFATLAATLDAPVLAEVEADGWCAVAAPLAGGEVHGWLILASPRAHFAGPLAKRAVETTAPLLVAMDQLKVLTRAQELAVRGALLEEILSGGDSAALATRAAVFGLDFSEPARVVIVRDAAALAGRPHLLSGDVALVQGDVADALGIGRAVESVADVPASLRDARLAARAGVVDYEDLDLATLLLSEAAPERLAPRVRRIVSVLDEHPPLRDALVTYFEHDLDVPATAAALHLHPNSLRYRLSRLEELLGCSLKHPATIAELHIALTGDARF